MSLPDDIKSLLDRRAAAIKELGDVDKALETKREELEAVLLTLGKTTPVPKPKKPQAPRGSVETAVRQYVSGHPDAAPEDIARIEQLNLGSVRSALRKIKTEKPAMQKYLENAARNVTPGVASPRGPADAAPLFTGLEPTGKEDAS